MTSLRSQYSYYYYHGFEYFFLISFFDYELSECFVLNDFTSISSTQIKQNRSRFRRIFRISCTQQTSCTAVVCYSAGILRGQSFPLPLLRSSVPDHETLITRGGVNKINGERGASNVTAVRRRINTKINKNADTNASINPCGRVCVCVCVCCGRTALSPGIYTVCPVAAQRHGTPLVMNYYHSVKQPRSAMYTTTTMTTSLWHQHYSPSPLTSGAFDPISRQQPPGASPSL